MKSLWKKFSRGNNPRKVLAGSLVLLLLEGLAVASLIYDSEQPGLLEVPTLGAESEQLPEYPGEVLVGTSRCLNPAKATPWPTTTLISTPLRSG